LSKEFYGNSVKRRRGERGGRRVNSSSTAFVNSFAVRPKEKIYTFLTLLNVLLVRPESVSRRRAPAYGLP
jgi:hypothetical protein